MTTLNLSTEIREADEARYQALYTQDLAALEAMLDDCYVHIHANGKVDDKASFLASIRAAKYRFVSAVRSDETIRPFHPVVVHHGSTRTTIVMASETKTMYNAFTLVWIRRDKRWTLLHWQATKILEA